ncbi:pyridoxamine 5'-phosphate oxidase family protein [Agromyces allii]|uniref:Pyridoxamine 5'-phosphate oxidase N-terminal domain-containing protein n=1 Tax=Agromyces allii TaxID=393607 RepID=A0ABP5BB00_9MICO|nr:pyridoxamine 5'-phosphate oxidase family protein [Agromyces allii]
MTDTATSAASTSPEPAPFAFDAENEVHARALARLASERIAWLGTTSRSGYPHAVPVWFLWHDGAVVILSEPGAVKVRNASRDPRALVHLESGHDEEQLTVLQGTAEVLGDAAASWLPAIGEAYLAKYEHDLPPLKLTLESMAAKYSTIIRVTPEKLIAW